jgi:hypothetical protein
MRITDVQYSNINTLLTLKEDLGKWLMTNF